MHDLLELPSVTKITNECVHIIKYINRSQILKAVFIDVQKMKNPNQVLGLHFL